ncbi:uncharacterized protein LOC114280186 [Camellia sinensis]|uniref:uncharacterized protein LOC114280186 n=1 Tax=Camellia sinensis TaxID=4442 RepID=UPI001036E055|nr:uncharacterized protein LOC114280186 [Camellia sinensis]
MGVSGLVLSYLQFADDSILFCEAKEEEVSNIKRVLRCFELISRLKINYHKIQVYEVGVPEETLSIFNSKLNCRSKSLTTKYMGLPLGANPNRKATWKPVLDKVRNKLAGWKIKLLSFAERLTLIKTVTSALPMYYLSLFRKPERVARELEKLQASFLCGGSKTKRLIHLVRWDELTKTVKQGGLDEFPTLYRLVVENEESLRLLHERKVVSRTEIFSLEEGCMNGKSGKLIDSRIS